MFYISSILIALFNGTAATWFLYGAFTNEGTVSAIYFIGSVFLYVLFTFMCIEVYGYHKKVKGMPFSLRLNMAKTIISQVKAGEWKPYVYPSYVNQKEIFDLVRNDQEMWVANGSFSLSINKQEVLGELLKLYVWHTAVKQVVKEANNKLANPQSGTDIINKTIGNKPTLKVVK